MIAMIDVAREFLNDPNIGAQQLVIFAHVADRREMPQSDLQGLVSVTQPTVAKHISRLMRDYHVLENFEESGDHRRKLVRLTSRGHDLAAAMTKAARRYLREA